MIDKLAKQALKLLAPRLDTKIESVKRDIIEYIFRKSKRMKAIFDYVNQPNELDDKVEELEKRILKQSEMSLLLNMAS